MFSGLPQTADIGQAIGNPETSARSIVAAGYWFQTRGVDPDDCDGLLDRVNRKIGGSRMAIRCRSRVRLPIEGLALSSGGTQCDSPLRSCLPRHKIADFKPIDQNYCCTVCISDIR